MPETQYIGWWSMKDAEEVHGSILSDVEVEDRHVCAEVLTQ